MRSAWLAVTTVVLLGCGSIAPWSHEPTPVPGLPQMFVPDSTFTNASPSDTTCLVHLIDPRSQTRLFLVRSSYPVVMLHNPEPLALGDYKVEPEGRFGIDAEHLLRVDCTAERPLGMVPE